MLFNLEHSPLIRNIPYICYLHCGDTFLFLKLEGVPWRYSSAIIQHAWSVPGTSYRLLSWLQSSRIQIVHRGIVPHSLPDSPHQAPQISWSYPYWIAAPFDKLSYWPAMTACQTTLVQGRGDTCDSDYGCLELFLQILWGYLETGKGGQNGLTSPRCLRNTWIH